MLVLILVDMVSMTVDDDMLRPNTQRLTLGKLKEYINSIDSKLDSRPILYNGAPIASIELKHEQIFDVFCNAILIKPYYFNRLDLYIKKESVRDRSQQ